LQPRSAYLLRDAARWEWQHSVPPVDALRYSVTFRKLAGDDGISPNRESDPNALHDRLGRSADIGDADVERCSLIRNRRRPRWIVTPARS
jgi:hypothetical protein